MALAILEFIVFEKGSARFRIDTGTNPYYRIKIGKSVSESNGIKWVDEVTHTTPMQNSRTKDYLLNTSKEIALPASYFDRDNCYAQLFSFKDSAGKSPAFSKVIKLPVGFKNTMHGDYLLSLSLNTNDMTSTDFNDCRFMNDTNDVNKFSSQQSFADILNVIKALGPVVQEVLAGAQNGTNNANGESQNPLTSLLPAGSWNTILNALLHGLSGLSATATPASATKSLSLAAEDDDNRFVNGSNNNFSQPFIFGIDDALLGSLVGSLAGPVLQALPQLLTALNQQKLQKQAANNKLITDLVADTNKRRILEQLLQNQTDQSNAAKAQLAQLLQQAAAAQANGEAAPATATTQSIDGFGSTGYSTILSTTTVVSFDTGNVSDWNGVKRTIYTKTGSIALKIKLNVPDPAPKNPLPKAIIKFYFKESEGAKPLLEKTFKQKDVSANTLLQFLFTKEEIAALPVNKNLMAFAEIRWLTKSGKEIKALGSTEVVMVSNYFLKEQGKPISEERELTDLKTYRAFWNKIWEAPVLDAANKKNDDEKKYMWQLDATLRYSFMLTADHDSNGLMPTKMLKGPADKESLTEKLEGRMKAGMELSINELNKLCALWDKQPVLPDEKRDALKNVLFIKNNASEFIYNAKLKGKAGQRGMIWVSPVFKLFSCKLNKIKSTNESGQVTEVEEETVQFPLPVSARIIGLKSA
jgi:hypothetical protein